MAMNLIEKILEKFLSQTLNDHGHFSRDYFERFTQLLNRTLAEKRSFLEKIFSNIISPFHRSNSVTFEYQLRLIRYSLRENLDLNEFHRTSFFKELFQHPLLIESSILRDLFLQIAILIFENDRFQSYDQIELEPILKRFSSDRNLYVQKSLAQFLALYIWKSDSYSSLKLLEEKSNDPDLLYRILMLIDEHRLEQILQRLNLYEKLEDTTVQRHFVLKTAQYLVDEESLLSFLDLLLEKSLADYVHVLLSVLDSRFQRKKSTEKLIACLKALFLLMKQTEIEEIDENQPSSKRKFSSIVILSYVK